jgi:hypothetical protein
VVEGLPHQTRLILERLIRQPALIPDIQQGYQDSGYTGNDDCELLGRHA